MGEQSVVKKAKVIPLPVKYEPKPKDVFVSWPGMTKNDWTIWNNFVAEVIANGGERPE